MIYIKLETNIVDVNIHVNAVTKLWKNPHYDQKDQVIPFAQIICERSRLAL